MRLAKRLGSLALTAGLALGLLASAPASAEALTAAPSGVSAVAPTNTTITVAWKSVKKAAVYSVRYATDKKFKTGKTKRTTEPNVTIKNLVKGTTYYLKVRVLDANLKPVTKYSKAVKVKTPKAKATTLPRPTGLRLNAKTSDSLDLAWNAVKGAAGYRLRIGTDAKFKSPTYLDVPTNAALASALASLQQYYVSVHAIDAKGAALSPESTILAAKTDAAPPAPQLQIPEYDIPGTLNVGTYNVFCANCTKSTSEQKPWTERKQLVIDNILNEDLDVVGLQEASQGWLKDANGKKYDKSQFEDLVEGLGANWAVTNNNRYNCANPKKSTNCVYTYQGASGGDRIAYRTDRLALLTAGSIQLPELDASYTDRFFTWATFTQISTGKQFFFGDTHLEPQKETKAPWTFYNLRQESTQLILDTIAANNPAGLPVILTGDLQGHKNSKPDNGPYNLLTANGLIDPLGNVKGDTPVNATVITRINTQYNSYNSFQRTALKQKGVNGQNFDYILTTAMTVLEYETVVNVDKDGKYVGVFPSDHNLLRARLLLP